MSNYLENSVYYKDADMTTKDGIYATVNRVNHDKKAITFGIHRHIIPDPLVHAISFHWLDIYQNKISWQEAYDGAGVYIVWYGENILYIGSSEHVKRKINQHISKMLRHWAKDWTRISIIKCEDIASACWLEKTLVEVYKPKWNR